jgi:hypothetical protein
MIQRFFIGALVVFTGYLNVVTKEDDEDPTLLLKVSAESKKLVKMGTQAARNRATYLSNEKTRSLEPINEKLAGASLCCVITTSIQPGYLDDLISMDLCMVADTYNMSARTVADIRLEDYVIRFRLM